MDNLLLFQILNHIKSGTQIVFLGGYTLIREQHYLQFGSDHLEHGGFATLPCLHPGYETGKNPVSAALLG